LFAHSPAGWRVVQADFEAVERGGGRLQCINKRHLVAEVGTMYI
jgi:hypothetical protein